MCHNLSSVEACVFVSDLVGCTCKCVVGFFHLKEMLC